MYGCVKDLPIGFPADLDLLGRDLGLGHGHQTGSLTPLPDLDRRQRPVVGSVRDVRDRLLCLVINFTIRHQRKRQRKVSTLVSLKTMQQTSNEYS